ncbi:MAG: pimeloyl-ACP methyl ester carboxylesterase [Candidatus Paceibacteria bacterium]|jgi:pimeloyl-ACP methyl ester carboxylesterase
MAKEQLDRMQIKANGIMLEYKEFGARDGVPLVMIRGLGTQLIQWPTELTQGFADKGYRVIVFDNRDIGLSQSFESSGVPSTKSDILAITQKGEFPALAYTLDDMAADVVGLMDALDIPKAHIFGISMGGAIAQLLLIDHAKRLLTGSAVMTGAKLRSTNLLDYILVEDENRDQFQDSWIKGHNDWGSTGFPMPEADIRAEAAAVWDHGYQAGAVNRQALATVSAQDRRELLQSVNVPTLVIHGAADTLIPADAGREIAALIPNADLEIIEGMGHVITPLLSPKIVKMVDAFINKNPR